MNLRMVRAVSALGLGLGIGAGLAALDMLVVGLAGWFDIRGRQALPDGMEAVYSAWLARRVVWEVLQSLGETALISFLFLGVLRRFLPLGVALGGAALLFGAMHVIRPHATPPICLSVAVVVGLPCAALFLWRGYWAAAGFHFAWNMALAVLLGTVVAGQERFGILDSVLRGPALWTGGSYGIEGSLTACLFSGAAVLMVLRSVRRSV